MRARRPNRTLVVAITLMLTVAFAALGLTGARRLDVARAAEAPPLYYIGSAVCAGCHQAQAKLWAGSHHKLAMDRATEMSCSAIFLARPSKIMASSHTSSARRQVHGRDRRAGRKARRVRNQVHVRRLPLAAISDRISDGRLQALGIAWDSRPKDKGGQRWFHLYPNEEVGHDDILHWTRLNQNWNFMCAECHSTGVSKNYDAATDTFATTWAEISVGCETCHGQGSAHVAWAHDHLGLAVVDKTDDPKGLVVRFDERKDTGWTIDPATGNATRAAAPAGLRKEVETCGFCHARRGNDRGRLGSRTMAVGHPLRLRP